MLRVYDPAQFAESHNYWLESLREDMSEIRQRTIRQKFDKCSLDSQAKACIDMAKELGYTELAAEMESDLETELLNA